MRPEEKEAKEKYGYIANDYHYFRTKKHPEGWIYNEFLEMPATLGLVGNVKGKKVLDFGCGSGIYTKLLKKKGAKIKGFDISKEMIDIARKENPIIDLRIGSGYKIPFKGKFDIVVASLVMDYLKDWDKVFKEVKRVLKKGGYFVFSVGNPVSESTERVFVKGKRLKVKGVPARAIVNYFEERKIFSIWKNILSDKKDIKMHGYHKTYETVIKIIVKNGFEIIGYKDCYPLKKSKKLFPEEYNFVSNIPYFCVWKVKKK